MGTDSKIFNKSFAMSPSFLLKRLDQSPLNDILGSEDLNQKREHFKSLAPFVGPPDASNRITGNSEE